MLLLLRLPIVAALLGAVILHPKKCATMAASVSVDLMLWDNQTSNNFDKGHNKVVNFGYLCIGPSESHISPLGWKMLDASNQCPVLTINN